MPPELGGKAAAVRNGGITNLTAVMAAAEAKVPNVVLINACMPRWLGAAGMSGYVEGKLMGAAAIEKYTAAAAGSTDKSYEPSRIQGALPRAAKRRTERGCTRV